MQIPQTVKDHPYAWGIGGFLVLVLLFYWLFKPSAQAASGGDPNASYYGAAALAAQSGNQLSEAQLAGNVAVNTAQIGADVQSQAISAAQTVALAQNTSQGQTAQSYINALLSLGTVQSNNASADLRITDMAALSAASLPYTGQSVAGNISALLDLLQNPGKTLGGVTIDPTTGTAITNTGTITNTLTGQTIGNVFSPAVPAPQVPTLGPVSSPDDHVGPLNFVPTSQAASNNNTPIASLMTVGGTVAA